MFSQFFGNYLMRIGKISADQFQTCMEYMRSNRVKLGLIAESEGILTRQQADELNRLQMQTDKRFGDLAIEKGYLTDNDISRLLKLQGNPYLIFIQSLEENDFIKRSDFDDLIADFQKAEGLSNSDLEAIKFDDFDRLLPSFIDSEEAATLAALAMRNLVRFVSSYIRLERATKVFSYEAPYIAYLSTGFDTISADDRTYFKKEHFSVELYTEKNDLTSEETLEKILGGAGIYYRKQGQQWLDDVNKYVTIYTM